MISCFSEKPNNNAPSSDYWQGFQSGAASRDAEIAQWQKIIDEEAKDSALVIIERDQLRAQINVLRDALQFLIATKELKESVGKTPEYEQMRIIAWGKATVAITSTPEQPLAEYRNKVIEECAVLCEKSDRYRGAYFAEKLRAMKEQP